MFPGRLFWAAVDKLLHLFKLMYTKYSLHILAVCTGLFTKARAKTRVFYRKLYPFKDLIHVHTGYCMLRCPYHVKVLLLYLVNDILKVIQYNRAGHRFFSNHVWWLD